MGKPYRVSLPLKLRNTWYLNAEENEEDEEGDWIAMRIERNWMNKEFEMSKCFMLILVGPM